MALWNINGEIVYSEGSLSIDPEKSSISFVKRHFYRVPYIVGGGVGGFSKRQDGTTVHLPSWTEVHPKTTFGDIIVEKKPFQELFDEPKKLGSWTFESSSSKKTYTVKQRQDGSLYCDCMGYIGHRKCKHITEVKSKL